MPNEADEDEDRIRSDQHEHNVKQAAKVCYVNKNISILIYHTYLLYIYIYLCIYT